MATAGNEYAERCQRTLANSDISVVLRERLQPFDLVPTVAVPTLLLVSFLLPHELKLSLALDYLDPTFVTSYASHFVHLSTNHLITNLVVYLAVVPLVLVLATLCGRRRQFYVVFVTILLAFPFVLSVLNVAFARPRIGFGFSGLNMAFLGFLPHTLVGYLSVRSGENFGPNHSPLLFFVGTAIIAFWAVPPTVASVFAGSVSVTVCLLYLRTISSDVSDSLSSVVRRIASEQAGLEFALAGVCLFVLLPFTAFPHRPVANGSILNLFTHLLGYCLGYIVPYVTFRFVSLDVTDV